MAITTSGTSITFNDATTQTTAYVPTTIIPSGTVMLFYQAAAPTGWTQVTTLNDYDLRLVSGAGGTTGGTTAYSTVFTNQTVSTTVSVSGTTGATTLSLSQIPGHSHNVQVVGNLCGGGGGIQPAYNGASSYVYIANAVTDSQGGGGSHSHSFSGSGSGTSSAVTLNVRYANIIICSKN